MFTIALVLPKITSFKNILIKLVLHISVCDMCECESDDADVPLRAPRRMQEMLREDYPDGCQPTTPASTLRYMPC